MAGAEGEKGKLEGAGGNGGRPGRTLWATVRFLDFVLSRWEPWRVLNRAGRGSDLGPHRISLAECREWTVGG